MAEERGTTESGTSEESPGVEQQPGIQLAEFWGESYGDACEISWRFLCPGCGACFDLHYDARDTDVECEHCPWKGKAGK
jgi:hypothetical protein